MKIRIKFQKQGTVRFIGHLDVMRYFQKVMRRAEVDIRYSEGFSPHQIMSFASPLSVGLISHAEYVDIDVNSSGNSTGMVRRLNEVSAEGLEVLSYRELPETAKNAMSLVAAADYTFWFKEGFVPEDGSSVEEFFGKFLTFCKSETIPFSFLYFHPIAFPILTFIPDSCLFHRSIPSWLCFCLQLERHLRIGFIICPLPHICKSF